MSDVTTDSEFGLVRDDVASALRRAETARRTRLEHEQDMLATCERQLSEAKERAQTLPLEIAKRRASIARLEAMSARDVVVELLPAPEPEQPTVAEHVKAPGMYAIWADKYWLWLGKGTTLTLRATLVEHYSEQEAAEKCQLDPGLVACRLDDLHTVDGLLKIKPGAKPAMLPGQVRP